MESDTWTHENGTFGALNFTVRRTCGGGGVHTYARVRKSIMISSDNKWLCLYKHRHIDTDTHKQTRVYSYQYDFCSLSAEFLGSAAPPIGFRALGLRDRGVGASPKTPKTPKTQLNKTNIKNGSKWVLSGHTTSPCNNLDQAKFLTHSKMGLNGYFHGTQPHHATI